MLYHDTSRRRCMFALNLPDNKDIVDTLEPLYSHLALFLTWEPLRRRL